DTCPVAAAFAQHRVRLRRPVTRNDVEWLIGLERAAELVQEIEYARIDWLDLVRAEVAKDVIQIAERVRLIRAAGAIRRLQALAGVRVEKRQHSLRGLRSGRTCRCLCAGWNERRGRSGRANAEKCPAVQSLPQIFVHAMTPPRAAHSCRGQRNSSRVSGTPSLEHDPARDSSSTGIISLVASISYGGARTRQVLRAAGNRRAPLL